MIEQALQTLPGWDVHVPSLYTLVARMAKDVNIPGDDAGEWVARVVNEARIAGQVLLNDAGDFLGLCTLMPHERWSEQHVADMRIWITPEFRGMGLGQELFEWAVANAQARGILRVEAINYETNERAHNWLLSLGFRNEGYRAKAIRTDTDGIIGAYMMACILGDRS